MQVTLFGMMTDIRLRQFLKAEPLMDCVPSLNVRDVLSGIVPLYLYATGPIYNNPSGWFSYHGVPAKASDPILVTLSGIVMSFRRLQPEKAP